MQASERERRDASAQVSTGRVYMRGEAVSIKASTHLWLYWGEIAIEHGAQARSFRAESVRLSVSGNRSPEVSGAMRRETMAAMVAVTAVAHALEAFSAAAKKRGVVPQALQDAWEKNHTARPDRILETLKLGYDIGKAWPRWKSGIDWLYEIRDAAIHFEEQLRDLAPHPIGTGASQELVTYSLESAERAVDLLMDVVRTCLARPKTKHAQLVAYAVSLGEDLRRLQELRDRLRS